MLGILIVRIMGFFFDYKEIIDKKSLLLNKV